MIQHLACIMDGNRRWAKRRGYLAAYGHREGALQTIPRVIDFCLKKGVRYVSLYAWALQNNKRSSIEREYLFGPLAREMHAMTDTICERKVRIRFIGQRTFFSAEIQQLFSDVEQRTAENSQLDVLLYISYGSREELVNAARAIAARVEKGEWKAADITPSLFESQLLTAGIPDPELIIRTGDHQRLSNFLLYQSAFSELYFLDCMWPDITVDHLEQAFSYYEQCQRNFGV